MTKQLWEAVPLIAITITAAWLAWAIWAFATVAPKAPPEPTPVSEPWRRLVVGCEKRHILESEHARSLAWGKSYGFLFFKYEDREQGIIKRVMPIRCSPFFDEPPYIEFEEQPGGEEETSCD